MDNMFSRMMKKRETAGEVVQKGDIKSVTQPWVEKYRPKKIDDVVYQEEVVKVLRNSLTGSDFPNLLFYGPPGTGKTSTILALAKEMFGDSFKQRVLELNASDERGISVIREKVKGFAQQNPSAIRGGPSFKIIVLDEADSMTTVAQSALRRIMEKESKSTRFCLICNYVSRIIEPIASRCAKFRFKPLRKDLITERLNEIVKSENMQMPEQEVIEEIVNVSEGDLRRAITILQTAARMKSTDEEILLEDIHEVSGHIPSKLIHRLTNACKEKSHEKVQSLVKELISDGYSGSQCISQLHQWIFTDKCFLNDHQKSIVCGELANADHCLLEGSNEYLQILNIVFSIIDVL